ncbi:hypothetical protein GMDG_00681 [Pseudogymnoascus destructans 20631-21]|uniref:Uncharacterized protein n=1 Tax=Pseudogymnoascus destructans (strain ATCC MYA-4855 / 20631-21) TaxID=658429 RepID=L8G9F3_PSED2|nr:hypothetical protein GMDG_00681 [Pseudogymnoascus destructans 20631-21]
MSASDEMALRLRYPYYVVHCSLWDASRDIDSVAMEGDGSVGGGERRNQQRRLMGTLVASPFSYLAVAFQTAFTNKAPSDEVAFHSVHSFDYIRQAILCNADTGLEGDTGHPEWGRVHQCTDIDKLREWANQRDIYKYRSTMPSDTVL